MDTTSTLLDEERKKRRFNTESYDRNRIIVGGDPSRYVNATYIREAAGGRWWVAAEVRERTIWMIFYSQM